MKKYFLSLLIVLSAIQNGFGAEDPLVKKTEETLKRAFDFFHSISINGGYAGIYTADLSKRYGEALFERARKNRIWVQPPGTPTVGESFLRAYKITGDKKYLAAAVDAARALVWGQRKIGGWDHLVNVKHLQEDPDKPVRKKGRCAFDDNITQGALTFLMTLDKTVNEEWLTEAIDLGLRFMMESQFENGAWSQYYPLIGGYHNYYTFNDNAINDCIRVMLMAHQLYGRDEYLSSAMRGGDFIIQSQLPAPQSGWAQQYSYDLKPAWARRFEPPGICSFATGRNIKTLVDLYLYTKSDKYLNPIPDAINWLESSMIGNDLWARLYEEGSNKPIYGDRLNGNKIFYNYMSISETERKSYGWQGSFGIKGFISYYNKNKPGGNINNAESITPLTSEKRKNRLTEITPDIEKIIASMDDKGRWVDEDGMIYSKVFVRNVNLLCYYLELSYPKSS